MNPNPHHKPQHDRFKDGYALRRRRGGKIRQVNQALTGIKKLIKLGVLK